ncbi:helix-turn-helix transcriptional regulator [Bacillus toyonensis]|uniref:helix-turn-helix domain-containing protein n=1 Tax=Bacillus toyonensis TaxID=155322 RepID=UPI002E1AF24C|nr:helix-turn-helix transcriptional regulator [Bacillus toyonensis]
MRKWAEVKTSIESISDDRKKELEYLVGIVTVIREKRKQLGWTQQELAEKAGLKQSAIARLEGAAAIPSSTTMFKVAIALGLKIKLVEQED